ncbi:secreted phosphoprotein 24 isoform X2 [Peromyscus californicus insignis]|uniref:secreted phosphoprotein 24 isoform X2 n=1 Tax=Peromyscus californicus insignis TaxID=564181 RepID=UPI0022A6CE6F|nr:secreted phosphoprotein 24 isoform X2 [Peromyscus californicus insignis]
MKWATLQTLVMLVLGMCYRCALGFPVYDFDPSSLQEALKASVAKVNSQSLSPYLFQETRSSLKRVNVLDEDTLVMNLEFSVQETTCLRDSGDPSSCTFRRGYYVMTFGDMARSYRRRNDYLLGFLSDESRSERFQDRSLETVRRGHPLAYRRFQNLHHRARINSGFE